MLIDYHVHTKLCKHAVGEPEAYIEKAIEKGLAEIGFSDHCPMPLDYDPESRMTEQQFPEYLNVIGKLQKRYPEIVIKLGIEVDYFPKYVDYVRKFVEENRFDYVIGAVHFLDSWGIDNEKFVGEYKHRDINEDYNLYFKTVTDAVETKIFDVVAHLDVIKKFGHKPENGYLETATETLKAIKENNLCIEVNTSGLRKIAKEVYPSDEILQRVYEMEIPIMLGSDSHAPSEVGWNFDEVVENLKRIGFKNICSFSGRKRTFVPLR